MRWIKQNERGYILLLVLVSILLVGIVSSTMVLMTKQSIVQNRFIENDTQALLNAQTGLNYVAAEIKKTYQSERSIVQTAWNNSQLLNPDTERLNIENDLKTIIPTTIKDSKGNPIIDYQVTSITDSYTSGSPAFSIFVNTQSTGYAGTIKKVLKQRFEITSVAQNLLYAATANTDIFIHGGVKINGSISAPNVYVNPYAWIQISGSNPLDDTSSLVPSSNDPTYKNYLFYSNFSNQSYVGAKNIYFFYNYSDQNPKYYNATSHIGDDHYVSQPITLVQNYQQQVNQTMFANDFGNQPPKLSNNVVSIPSVGKIVDTEKSFLKLPPTKYTFNLSNQNDLNTFTNALNNGTVYSQPLYINGNVTIKDNQQLIISGNNPSYGAYPLYINGNLTIDGEGQVASLQTNGPVFVEGNITFTKNVKLKGVFYQNNSSGTVTLTNMTQTIGDSTQRVQIWAKGTIVLHGDTSYGSLTTPTNLNLYLGSMQNIYVSGMVAYYNITGGVTAPIVVLNASYGDKMTNGYNYSYVPALSADLTKRRLTINFDPTFVNNPMAGSPGMSDLSFVVDSQPYLQQ